MAYILSINRSSPEETIAAFKAYRRYLASVRHEFPSGALALVESDWYFEAHPKSPHDAWLDRLSITEQGTGSRMERRETAIVLRLLASYHNGFIEFSYIRVKEHSFSMSAPEGSEVGHGDWLWDEFTLSPNNSLIHDIEWQHGKFRIVADDVQYSWHPIGEAEQK